MNRRNFETGVQRVYYVAWACMALLCLAGAYHDFIRNRESPDLVGVATVIGVGAIALPTAIMLCARWIYRGFIPNDKPHP